MAWIKEITDESTGAVATYWEMFTIFYEHTKSAPQLANGAKAFVQQYALTQPEFSDAEVQNE